MISLKAYGVLAEQPSSIRDIRSEKERNAIIVSAALDAHGRTCILSRYGDDIWEMWPFFEQSNVPPSGKKIHWKDVPEEFRDVCKAVAYHYWMVGIPGTKRPGAATLKRVVRNLGIFMRYLRRVGITSMADVRPLHISNYVHEKKEAQLVPSTLHHHFIIIEILHHFKDQHADRLTFHPWPDSSSGEVAGCVGYVRKNSSRTGKTALIPKDVSRVLYCFAENVLSQADAVLDARDVENNTKYKRNAPLIRDACFYLLGVLTGMRCEELVGIELGAGRTEIRDGISYHWVKSIEHKTFKGNVEYMMPAMGHQILRILERWSEPLRERLKMQVTELESGVDSIDLTKKLELIATAKRDLQRLFLGDGGAMIRAISGTACGGVMRSLAKRANVSWDLAPHQMRRLYAWTFVRHRLGNLLFLKEQFKHSSIDMSQLYAANPQQDSALYDEILAELHTQKVDIIQGWVFDERPLTGGAGKKVMKLRAHDFPNRKAMIEDTADKLNLRSTGHGWCLAQDEGCGGAGLYEQTRCVDCGNGLIDFSFVPVWKEIHRHQLELLDEVKSLGLGAAERVNRDIAKAEMVLMDLGVNPVGGVLNDRSDVN